MSRQPRIELSAERIQLDAEVGIRLVGDAPRSELTDRLWNKETR